MKTLRSRVFAIFAACLVAGFAAAAFFVWRDFRASSAVSAYRAETEPARLQIAKIGLDSPVVSVGFEPNSRKIAVPDREVGWFADSATPDRPGVVFLDGHSDGVFARLSELATGDHLTMTLVSGITKEATYEVYSVTTTELSEVNMKQVLAAADYEYELVLMTCAGDFQSDINTYTHRLVLRARRL